MAALYQVANAQNIPIVSIKVISDIIGQEIHKHNTFDADKGAKLLEEVYLKLLMEE